MDTFRPCSLDESFGGRVTRAAFLVLGGKWRDGIKKNAVIIMSMSLCGTARHELALLAEASPARRTYGGKLSWKYMFFLFFESWDIVVPKHLFCMIVRF